MEATLQGIFTSHYKTYAKDRKLTKAARKAAAAIMGCRTAAMGGHAQRCPDGHITRIQYNSCRHRSCPRCAAMPRARWAENQSHRLLGCDHYHVVFTLPHELLELWQYNQAWFVDALFQSVRDTLMELLSDERYLGALPGILMALHTWGRNLSLHPHLHCLVTGGGLSASSQWKSSGGFLLPVRVVKAVYRGKLLSRLWEALKAGQLQLSPQMSPTSLETTFKNIAKKHWSVRIQERYSHGKGVMLYLARYIKGGPLKDQRLDWVNNEQVCFHYKDHRDGKTKPMRLSIHHFMDRIMWHVPHPGQHTIRHYGLYGSQARNKRRLCREQLGQEEETLPCTTYDWTTFWEKLGKPEQARCPKCNQLLIAGPKFPRVRNENSIGSRQPLAVGMSNKTFNSDASTRYLDTS